MWVGAWSCNVVGGCGEDATGTRRWAGRGGKQDEAGGTRRLAGSGDGLGWEGGWWCIVGSAGEKASRTRRVRRGEEGGGTRRRAAVSGWFFGDGWAVSVLFRGWWWASCGKDKEAGRTRWAARGGEQDEAGGTRGSAGRGNGLWLVGRWVGGELVVHCGWLVVPCGWLWGGGGGLDEEVAGTRTRNEEIVEPRRSPGAAQ